ncbi:MAG TPA: hypothetical protein VFG20_21915 [Planctomycetaceae bacterium]|nr:hypothetical protein [Planctomycetaceae bacterium]
MQRQQIGNTNNTINTNNGFGFVGSIGGTYARLPRASAAAAHAVHDVSDPVKRKRVSVMRSRPLSTESWRLDSAESRNGTPMTPAGVVMPPRLWASWVLCQSLCG